MVHDVSDYPHCNGSQNESLEALHQKLQMLLLAKGRGSCDTAAAAATSHHFRPMHCLLRYCLGEETARAEHSCKGYDFHGLIVAVTFIAKVDPAQFAARDAEGDLPLHIITKHQQGGIAATDAYEDGRLPLNSAASNKCISPACCKVLSNAAPQLLTTADCLTGLYPFQAASKGDNGSSDTPQLDLVHIMLLGAPHVLSAGNYEDIRAPCENMCLGCNDDMSQMKKELEALWERTVFLEGENIKLQGFVGEFGSPGNIRKRSKSAWV